MSILFTNEILQAVKSELNNASDSVQIISAYCKKETFKMLDSYVADDVVDRKVMLRFRLDDLIKGSTDIDVIEMCQKKGWKLYIRFDLHAKTYIVDNKRGILGSANATNSGLGISPLANSEMATFVDVEDEDVKKIENLYRDSILVDSKIAEKLQKQYVQSIHKGETDKLSWERDILEMFHPQIDTLFSYELPDTNEFQNGMFIQFLDCVFDNNKDEIKDRFRWSNAYLWLLDVLSKNDGCLYFGALTEKLHNSLVSDPRPYRKDVKVLLANLLNMIEYLNMDEIVIDRPNYSQRIRLV